MRIKIKRLHPEAVMPAKATDGSAGFDLTAISHTPLLSENQVLYDTGLAFEIPAGYVGLLFQPSSLSRKKLRVANAVGVLDSDYRGSVTFVFDRLDDGKNNVYMPMERIGQIVFVPVPAVELLEVDELSKTGRGAGGYGSTGR